MGKKRPLVGKRFQLPRFQGQRLAASMATEEVKSTAWSFRNQNIDTVRWCRKFIYPSFLLDMTSIIAALLPRRSPDA
jgi:hypothetical protein